MRKISLGLFVSDMKRSVEFYRNVFNTKISWSSGPYAEFLVDDSYLISLHYRKEFEKILPQKPEYPSDINGTMELALNYTEFAEVDQEFERFVQAGATAVLEPFKKWGMRMSFVADPDGNLIEISSYGKDR